MKSILFSRPAFLLASLTIAAALTGCASPITHETLVPAAPAIKKQHPQSVAVTAGGGGETSAAGKSNITDAELQRAVAKAISQSKVFSQVVEGKSGDYVLNVNVFNLQQPSMGFSFTVHVEMGWTLTRADSGAIVWRESIKSQHTTGAGEAFAGVERLRLATEGAIRANIQQGLEKLSGLNL